MLDRLGCDAQCATLIADFKFIAKDRLHRFVKQMLFQIDDARFVLVTNTTAPFDPSCFPPNELQTSTRKRSRQARPGIGALCGGRKSWSTCSRMIRTSGFSVEHSTATKCNGAKTSRGEWHTFARQPRSVRHVNGRLRGLTAYGFSAGERPSPQNRTQK